MVWNDKVLLTTAVIRICLPGVTADVTSASNGV